MPGPAEGNNVSDNGHKFVGVGFGTAVGLAIGEVSAPRAASDRELLRGGLPAVYQQGEFGMAFVGALERVLDPVVALLDNLPYHFDYRYAPRDLLGLVTAWLGLEHDERLSRGQRRALIRNAAQLVHRRGTRDGLELALTLAFPGVPLRVEDNGGVRVSRELVDQAPAAPASFVVYCDKPIADTEQAAIARVIERVKPAHTAYRLRVKAARKGNT
jgi:phage tail-like protein